MRWEIQHRTRYEYAAPVRDSYNELRLQPLSNGQQTVEGFALNISPVSKVRQYHDFYSNCVHHFEIPEPHSTLLIESRFQVETHSWAQLALDAHPAALSRAPEALRGERTYDFLLESRYVDTQPETWRRAVDAAHGIDDIWQCGLKLMEFVHSHLTYERQSTHVHTHMREVLVSRRGVCQDFAHVLLGLCRALKIPALYVSGYLATEKANATHAWTEIYVPGAGWQGLDPTHNRPPDQTYVKVAVGRDYADVPPVSGTYKGTTERVMTVDVRVDAR